MRKLASIRRITDVQPIEGADAIEVVIVDGWKVVSKKGEFQPGDLCVYFEIDSVLPIRPEFEFLRKGCHVKRDWLPEGEGFRLKTIRLRKQISQGLVIPSTFGQEGDDVTEILGVVKWDPPVPAQLSGKVRGNFPSFIPKTDQERVQNLRNIPEGKYEVTIKLDGSSMTAYKYEGRVGVCSRNLDLDLSDSSAFIDTFKSTGLEKYLDGCVGNIAFQGELMGPGIQGNREGLTKYEYYVYDVYLIDEGRYATAEERYAIFRDASTHSQIKHVPILEPMILEDLTIDDILRIAEGPSINHKVREGLVFKGPISFKAISNAFLMKG